MELVNMTDFRSLHKVLVKPMNQKELTDNVRKDGSIQAKVLVDFDDLVNNDLEWLNDEVSERITGSIAGLTDISFNVAGRTTNDQVIVKVTGVPELEEED